MLIALIFLTYNLNLTTWVVELHQLLIDSFFCKNAGKIEVSISLYSFHSKILPLSY